jgi:hypothetical protein
MKRPRHFKDNATLETRAVQIWQILVGCAARRETVTYQRLANMLGHDQPKVLAKQLGRIFYYCKQYDLPPLTIVVVNKNTGRPGDGLPYTDTERGKLRERVFQFDWYAVYPPTAEEFAQAYDDA